MKVAAARPPRRNGPPLAGSTGTTPHRLPFTFHRRNEPRLDLARRERRTLQTARGARAQRRDAHRTIRRKES